MWSDFGSGLLVRRILNHEINRIESTMQTEPRAEINGFGVSLKLKPLRPTPEFTELIRRIATRDTESKRRVQKIVGQFGIRHTSRTTYLPGRPDLLLPNYGIAIFEHGCSWHGWPRY